MKINITMKDPDAAYDAIREAVRAHIKTVAESGVLDEDEVEYLVESKSKDVTQKLCGWMECGEYLRLEYDTETDLMTVKRKGAA